MSNSTITPHEVSASSKKCSAVLLLCATVLAFALGWAAAQLAPYGIAKIPGISGIMGKQSQPQAASTANAASADGSTTADTPADALQRFNAIDWNTEQPPAGADKLAAALPGNTPLRQAALERYRQAPQGSAKFHLAQLLTAQALPEVTATASAWAQQADSAAVRADGFNLLRQMPPQPATYQLARHALEHEQDPAALAAAVWALTPVGMPDPAQVKQVVPRLHSLTQHPLPDMRSASIQRLAEWDRARRYFTQDALRLMTDANDDVRIAAVGATSIAGANEDAIKTRFFEMLDNPKEDAELRSIVLMQLDRFGLTPKEYATYQAVQRSLFGKAGGG